VLSSSTALGVNAMLVTSTWIAKDYPGGRGGWRGGCTILVEKNGRARVQGGVSSPYRLPAALHKPPAILSLGGRASIIVIIYRNTLVLHKRHQCAWAAMLAEKILLVNFRRCRRTDWCLVLGTRIRGQSVSRLGD